MLEFARKYSAFEIMFFFFYLKYYYLGNYSARGCSSFFDLEMFHHFKWKEFVSLFLEFVLSIAASSLDCCWHLSRRIAHELPTELPGESYQTCYWRVQPKLNVRPCLLDFDIFYLAFFKQFLQMGNPWDLSME